MSSVVIIITGLFNLILGAWVWLTAPRKRLNYIFGLFSLVTALVCLFDFIFRFFPTVEIVKWSFAFAVLLPNMLVLLLCELADVKLSKIKSFLILLPGIIFFIITIATDLIIKQIHYLTILGYRGEVGEMFPYYSNYIFLVSLAVIIAIYQKQKKASPLKKAQYRYVLAGLLFYCVSGSFFSLLLPSFFKIYDLTLLDAPSSLFFVVFTTYAILKHKLFDIKVVATELLAFFISMTLLIDALFAKEMHELVLRFLLFIFGSVLGGLLIRGVLGEIKSKEHIKELADDLSKTNKQLRSANRELKRLDAAKSEFLSIASHQLRTPLSAIKGLSSMMLDGDFGPIDGEQKDTVNKIFFSSERLNKLIESLLNISRIESGKLKLNFEEKLLEPIVKDVVDELVPVAEQKGLIIKFEPQNYLPKVSIDPEKMREVVMNLVDNSLKYTDAGVIKVSLSLADGSEVMKIVRKSCQYDFNKHLMQGNEGGKFVVFCVADNGRGVIKSDQYHLFQKFTRGQGMFVVHTEGTGLGLYVCRKIIEGHKGLIWVESEGEGKGSKFCFALKAVG